MLAKLLVLAISVCVIGQGTLAHAQFNDPNQYRPDDEAPVIPVSPSGVPMSQANPEDITDKNYPDLIENFDYPDVDIRDLVKVMSELTGKNFIVDPTVRSKKITIIARSPITVAQAYKAFLSAMAINGITVVPSGPFLKIVNAKEALKDSIETYSGAYFPNSDQMITKIVKLKYIPATELEKSLRSLYSRDGDLKVYEPTNSLIISDYGSNVDRIVKIVDQLDVPGFEEKMEVVPVLYAAAKDIADLINDIITKGEGSNRFGAAGGVPRFRRAGAQGDAGTSNSVNLSFVTADPRTNSIIVLGNQEGIRKAKGLIKQLDFKVNADAQGGVYVYYVKHSNAEDIEKTLSGIAEESKKAIERSTTGRANANNMMTLPETAQPTSSAAVFKDDVVIRADKNTNSLIITASKQDYDRISNILSKIDIARDQVFVETVIMEIDLQRSREVGVSAFNLVPGDKQPDGSQSIVARQGFQGGSNALAEILDPTSNPAGGIFTFGAGTEFLFKNPVTNTLHSVTSLLGLVKLIQTSSIGHVLSTPKIVAMDNEKAIIEVGQEFTIKSGSTVANGVTQNNIISKTATIKLEITPSINPGSESVRLKLNQIVDQPGGLDENDNRIIEKKGIETNIVVNNSDTAVLGGLINDSDSVSTSKVPLLGDIPILGWLFRSRQVTSRKKNLVVFITPKIIRNPTVMKDLVQGELDKRLEFIKKEARGVDPYGQTVDEISKVPNPLGTNDNWDGELQMQDPSESDAIPFMDDTSSDEDFEDFFSESPGADSL